MKTWPTCFPITASFDFHPSLQICKYPFLFSVYVFTTESSCSTSAKQQDWRTWNSKHLEWWIVHFNSILFSEKSAPALLNPLSLPGTCSSSCKRTKLFFLSEFDRYLHYTGDVTLTGWERNTKLLYFSHGDTSGMRLERCLIYWSHKLNTPMRLMFSLQHLIQGNDAGRRGCV